MLTNEPTHECVECHRPLIKCGRCGNLVHPGDERVSGYFGHVCQSCSALHVPNFYNVHPTLAGLGVRA